MNLFLDCEFNGFNGALISMALVDEKSTCFYEVLECTTPIKWVAEHVIPRLNKTPIQLTEFQSKLKTFLFNYDKIHIIADWPEDISLFLNSLIVSPGRHIVTPMLTMALWKPEQNHRLIDSQQPHNALSDAFALLKNYQNRYE